MRFPAFATSLAVHAAVLTTVLLVPILGDGPLPATTPPEPPIHDWPMTPRVAFADARPAAAPLPRRAPRRTTDAPMAPVPPDLPPGPVSVEVPDLDPATDPQAGEDVRLGEADPGGNGCDTGARCASGDPEGGGLGTTGTGSASGPVRVRMGGLVVPPTKVRHVDPVYPEIARQARVSANVVLDCLLDVEGQVTEIRIVSGHPLLDAAAKDAVARWRYTPTYLNGTAVPVLLTVTVRFTMAR